MPKPGTHLCANVPLLDTGARGSSISFAAVAEEYLKYLYSEEGQDIAGKNFYRPAVSEKAKAKYAQQFPRIELFTITEAFGGWSRADKEHFRDGGTFDQVYTRN